MELYVYGNTRQLVGVVESFEYLRWTRRYSQCGAFELKAIATPENIALLVLGNLLWNAKLVGGYHIRQNLCEELAVSCAGTAQGD